MVLYGSCNACECGNGHNLAKACDNKTITSAVLDLSLCDLR